MADMKRIEIKNNKLISFGYAWNVENSIGNVIIVTDILDRSSRYDDVAKFLNDNNFDVYCVDMFGQGENVLPDLSNLGIVPTSGFRKQVQAIDILVRQLRLSARPTFMLAMGFGAIICQDYIQRYTEHVSKVAFIGCPYIKNISFKFFFAKIFQRFIKRDKKSLVFHKDFYLKYCKKDNLMWLTDETKEIEKYSLDPLCGFNPSFGFYFEYLKGINRLYKKKFLMKIRKDLDILLISSNQDPLTHNGNDTLKIASIYNKLKINNVDTEIIDVKAHEVLFSSVKTDAYKLILDFFLQDIDHKNVV